MQLFFYLDEFGLEGSAGDPVDAPVLYRPNANGFIDRLCASRGLERRKCTMKVGIDHEQSLLKLKLIIFDPTSTHSKLGQVTQAQGIRNSAKFTN